MAYSGTGVELDPYVVDNITDFMTCINAQANVYVKLAADIDCTGKQSIPCKQYFHLDGDGYALRNIAIIDDNSLFAVASGAEYQNCAYIENLTVDMMYISITNSSRQRPTSHSIFTSISNNPQSTYSNRTFTQFKNCNINAKIYLSNPGTTNYRYNFIPSFGIYNCNIVVDVYYIMAHEYIVVIFAPQAGSSTYNKDGIKDSIVKITLYDPNGWALANTDPYNNNPYFNFIASNSTTSNGVALIQDESLNNSGIIVKLKEDINISQKDRLPIYGCTGSSSYYPVNNSYFVFENIGNVKTIKPVIRYCYFATYAFYDNELADNWTFYSLSYHYGSAQFAGLTTAQCKDRSTFEGPTAILPFKLKQDYEP